MKYPLLAKWLIKDYKNTSNAAVRVKYGTVAGGAGLFTNFLIGAAKVIIGIISGSISIISDAVNNLSDSVSSLVTMISYKMSMKKADKDHPFGHQRIEFIASLIIAVIMLAIGALVMRESIGKIINPVTISVDWLTLGILGGSLLIKLWQCFFYRNMGKAINSITLKSTSKDSLNDVITTGAVIIGTLIYFIWHINLDGYFGAIVALYVIYSSIQLIVESSSPLIGTVPSPDVIKGYKKEMMSYKGVLGVHDIVIHSYGPTKMFMTAHAEVSSSVPITISHDVIDNIERDFLEKQGIDLTIHLDPIDVDDPYTNALRNEIRAKVKEINPSFDIHDFRVVRGESHTKVLFDLDLPDYSADKFALQKQVEDLVKDINPKLIPKVGVDQVYDRELKG